MWISCTAGWQPATPGLYLIAHGGFVHSIAGAVAISVLATAGIRLASLMSILPPGSPVGTVFPGSPCRGIPPHHHRCACLPRHSPALPVLREEDHARDSPGPELFLFGVSVVLLLATVLGTVTFPAALRIAAAVIVAFLACRATGCLAARRRWPGTLVVPTQNLLKFFVIGESDTAYTIRQVSLAGESGGVETFEKYTGTDRSGTEDLRDLPEVWHLRFHSYGIVVEKTPSGYVFSDPFREKGYFPYPPRHTRVVIPAGAGPFTSQV